nr:hypothetical protein [Tanacetum cinerariifolium]
MVAYLEKSDDNTEFYQRVDFLSSCSINYALTQIHAIVDSKAVVISESSVRSDLLFDDEGDEAVHHKGGDKVERVITSHVSLEEAQASDNILKTQTTIMPNVDIPQGIDTGDSPRRQDTMGGTFAQTRVFTLENELSRTKAVYHKAFITLTKRVKKLETQVKKQRSRAVIYSSNKEEPKTLLNIKRSTAKDKGKGIMQETKLPNKIKKREMLQLSLDEELSQKLYAEELSKETTRQEHEKYNLKKALELQRQLDKKEKDTEKGDHAKEIDSNDPTVLRYHAF